ncbi:hypothetical protein [Synechococcus sp. H65.1]|uniref:hypothetical protein n=1 Tax=unclassified Synechococcus TaxID=2626047 RepID=UPI0039C100A0
MTPELGSAGTAWVVCALNGLLFLGLLALLRPILRLRAALWVTERALESWQVVAERALATTSAELLHLRARLQANRTALDRWRRRLQFWQGIRQLVLWLRRSFYG